MRCPRCQHDVSKVLRSNSLVMPDGDTARKRQRQCTRCAHKYDTYECYELADVEVSCRVQAARTLFEQAMAALYPQEAE